MKKLNLAIIGQGRSGKLIHGLYYRSRDNIYYNIAAVVEADGPRRKKALEDYPGCTVYENYRELLERKDIDLVVNASYSEQHFEIAKDLLEHGFNVLTEKPFARNYYECETLIKTAEEHNVTLAVFQQTNLAPFFEFTKQLIESGKIGDVKQINIKYNGWSRRWDWQTLQKKMGGSVYNTGPHPIGIAMGLMDFDKDIKVIYSKLDTAVTSGDAEDYAKILMTAPGRPLFDIEINAVDAYTDYNIKVMGTKGCYKCTTLNYKMKYITDGENPERPACEETLRNENDDPIYCSEKLIWHEEEDKFPGDAFGLAVGKFYENLYFKLTENRPLCIDPEKIARIINVIEKTHADSPLPLKF